ncbi:MAG: four helix bundle protein [FCB group bacterium]|nr:four helix bundle protein [FCB group bacterium]MBL7028739.1 four helix bundle protein [Candidatus Neomarinimicrobiota bacterium]MBL7120657.1 four helix bundle protein [Candidatus Neomarinimicrobiota bacterium]
MAEAEKAWDLKVRTRQFALDCISLVADLPKSKTGQVIGHQLLRSLTSVGANYRAASLAQSKPAFRAKLSIVLEEADECAYWLDLIIAASLLDRDKVIDIYLEAQELTKIFAAARKKIEQR